MAAGCSFEFEKYEQVCEALHKFALVSLKEEDLVPRQRVDLEIDPGELNLRVCEELSRLEPFGVANPEPVFLARGTSLIEIKPCKNPVHVNLTMRQGESAATKGIAFNMGDAFGEYGVGARVDLLFKASVNDFRGSRSMQWKINDACLSC